MLKVQEVHSKIIDSLRKRGPSLPIQVAKDMAMSSLFVSAFLSELVDDKKVKVSSLKVGGTPLYYLEGQEEKLENFYKFLHPKEAEAFELIKKQRILKDSEQEPAIRVALRAINDFAFSFKNDEDIYWRYLTVQEPEIINIFESKPKKQEANLESSEVLTSELAIQSSANLESSGSSESEITLKKPKLQKKRTIKEKTEIPKIPIEKIEIEPSIEFQNPLAVKPIEKPKKEKLRSDFVARTIVFLNKNNFRIVEEKEYRAKEYNCIVEISSDLGKILFLTQAKDKKTISDIELQTHLSKAQSIPLPALFLYTGSLSKKAQEYLEKYTSILKAKKIE